MITADTITDAMIRELAAPGCDRRIRALCKLALGDTPRPTSTFITRRARQRLADLINARAKEST